MADSDDYIRGRAETGSLLNSRKSQEEERWTMKLTLVLPLFSCLLCELAGRSLG